MNENPKTLLIVESPAKCKTISGYLPKNFEVIATYGHIKSLKKDDGSVLPDEGFRMIWEANNEKRIKDIIAKAKEVNKQNGTIILATDPDREGEAIGYHVYSTIAPNISCKVKRVLFNEISKHKILEALANPLEINQAKVDSYFARIALDYLIGFNLSPILWKKLKGCKSAGRVQSAVMRAIIERETEILQFKPQKYWTITSVLNISDQNYEAELYSWMQKPLEKFMWTAESAKQAAETLKSDSYKISNIEKKEIKKNPYAPFTTSTMQQEAASRYGWAPSKTSSVAQNLYEGVSINGQNIGLVTYIRTDSVRIADDALASCEKMVEKKYGKKFVEVRKYANKSKTAQDGHEAIRPTDFNLFPWDLNIDREQQMLYDLVWRRAVGSQMSSAIYNVTNVFIDGKNGSWKVHGREQIFKGFLEVYQQDEAQDALLGPIEKTSPVKMSSIKVNDHSTQPKPQYTESSLVKHMDEVSIGRPSTYAYTLKILETREYIKKENKKIVPTTKGWIVNGFLDENCKQYIQDTFTADVEDQLDLIAEGKREWTNFASAFWSEFSTAIAPMNDLDARNVLEAISSKYDYYFFGPEDKDKQCPNCTAGKKALRILPTMEFISCSNYPACTWKNIESLDVPIGIDPNTNDEILLKTGKHGPYFHWTNEKKNVSVPKQFLDRASLELAMQLRKMPIVLGAHPQTGQDIKLNIGMYGTYVMHNGKNVPYPLKDLEMASLQRAIELIDKREQEGDKPRRGFAAKKKPEPKAVVTKQRPATRSRAKQV